MLARRTAHPLPEVPHVPGQGADPRTSPDWVVVGDEERFAWGADLFDAGFYWEAHEVWEERWRSLPEGSLAARHQQALLLVSAALHKAAVGQLEGADELLARGRRVFNEVTSRRGEVVAGLDVAGLLGATEVALRGGDPPSLGEARGLRSAAGWAGGPSTGPAPQWPPFVQDWVLPYVSEPALWPVLLALLGHVVVVIVPLCLAVARTGSMWAVAALLALGVGSAALVRWEVRIRGRPAAVAATVSLTWLVSLVSAWGAAHLGVL